MDEISAWGFHGFWNQPTPLSEDQRASSLSDDEMYPLRMEFPSVSAATLKAKIDYSNKGEGGEKTAQNCLVTGSRKFLEIYSYLVMM